MTREFEARTEQEAIELAIEELHIEREDFDVEVIDNGHRGLFKKSNVKIRVHVDTEEPEQAQPQFDNPEESEPVSVPHISDEDEDVEDLPVDEEYEAKVCEFIEGIITRMGYSCKAVVSSRKGRKVNVDIQSPDTSIIIGRKGKNLDAVQVLANVFAGNIDEERKIIVDAEGYRLRHEESIVRMAYKTAQLVRKSGRSKLLEPMNPYERRLVHTALNDVTGIETKSEGEGLYKQVRIIPTRH